MMWGHPYYQGFGYGAGWYGMGFMMLFGLFAFVSVVLLVVWLMSRASGQQAGYRVGASSACEIAKMRYARGEITTEQYHEICRTLGAS